MIYFVTKDTNYIELVSQLNSVFTSEISVRQDLKDCFEWCSKQSFIEVDTETTGSFNFSNTTTVLQLGSREVQWVIQTKYFPLSLFKDLFYDTNKLFIFQNAKFDLKFFRFEAGIDSFFMNVADTFINECILTTGNREEENYIETEENTYEDVENIGKLNLEAIVKRYIPNATISKATRGLVHKVFGNVNSATVGKELLYRVLVYCAEDVTYLTEVYKKQMTKIKDENLMKTYDLEVNKALKGLIEMEYNGMPLNPEKWNEVAKISTINYKDQVKKLDNLVMTEPKLRKYVKMGVQASLFDDIEDRPVIINYTSPKQKLEMLRNLGFNLDSTEDRFLQRIKRKHKIVAELIEYNKEKKRHDSFGYKFLKFINPNTERIHPDFWQIVNTGRVSCKKPNLLNIPSKGDLAKKVRAAFEVKPDSGNKIVGGDYSAMELCVIAELSGEESWIDELNSADPDLHSELAAATFGIPRSRAKEESNIKKGISYRDIQKTINFGLAYGMSEYKLADTLEISVQEAVNIINAFFVKVPKVKLFLDRMAKYAMLYGHIYTPYYERKRYFPQWQAFDTPPKEKGEIERAAKNTPIQGCNADIIKDSWHRLLVNIKTDNKFGKVKLINSIYDEILTEVPSDIAVEWKDVMEREMIDATKVVFKKVKAKVDIKITDYWTK